MSNIDAEELIERLETLLKKLDCVIREISPKLIDVGNMREEVSLIYKELEKRGQGAHDGV
jgi:hypothetical protein